MPFRRTHATGCRRTAKWHYVKQLRGCSSINRSWFTVLTREYAEAVKLTIELDREEDGRWIAETLELPGVMCYGQTRDEAVTEPRKAMWHSAAMK